MKNWKNECYFGKVVAKNRTDGEINVWYCTTMHDFDSTMNFVLFGKEYDIVSYEKNHNAI